MKLSHSDQMIDITAPDHECEVAIKPGPNGVNVWVNIDGICRLRVCHLDPRKLSVDYRPREIIDSIALSHPQRNKP